MDLFLDIALCVIISGIAIPALRIAIAIAQTCRETGVSSLIPNVFALLIASVGIFYSIKGINLLIALIVLIVTLGF